MFSFFSHFKLTKSKLFDCTKMIKSLLHLLLIIHILPSNIFALESNNLEGTALNLFGISIHSELRNEIFIGAMFAPSEIDRFESLYDTAVTKKMSLRFLQAYSTRKVARLWKQRIAMNNEKSHWQPLTKEIVRFTKIFKQSMQAGDEISLVYIPNKGTKVYLNGSLFLLIQNPQFYSILLNTWYGSVPPSKLFNIGITGKNTDYLQKKIISQYESLVAILSRFDKKKPNTINSNRVNPSIKKNSVTAKKIVSNPIKNKSKALDSSTQSLIDGFKPKLPDSVTSKDTNGGLADKEKLFKVNIGLTASNLNSSAIKPIDLFVVPADNQRLKNEIKESPLEQNTIEKKTDKLIVDNILKPTDVDEINLENLTNSDDSNNIDRLEAASTSDNLPDNDLISGTYTRELIEHVKKNQKYPKKALQKNHEGDLIISLTVNAIGKITDLWLLQPSGSRYLDRGVLKQVRGIESFPPIPNSLNLDSFNVEIPMNFSFSK